MSITRQQNCGCRIAQLRKCRPYGNPNTTIQELANLLKDPDPSKMIGRQLLLLNDYLQSCACGFCICDLPFLICCLELLADKLPRTPLYREPYERLLYLCSFPPLLCKPSQNYTFMEHLQQYYSTLGYLLVYFSEQALQCFVLQALWNLLYSEKPRCMYHVRMEQNYMAVEKSTLPETIAQLLEIGDADLYPCLLDFALYMTKISHKICERFVLAGVLDFILIRLLPNWKTGGSEVPSSDLPPEEMPKKKSRQMLKDLMKILCGKNLNFLITDNTPINHSVLRYYLRLELKKGSNGFLTEVLSLLLLCLEAFPDMAVVDSGLADDIAILTAANEVDTTNTWAPEVKLTLNANDLMLRKTLLHCLIECFKRQHVKEVLKRRKVIKSLLSMVSPSSTSKWHAEEYKQIVELTFRTLHIIGPLLISDFIMYDGPVRYLILVEIFIVKPYDLDILASCLGSFRNILQQNYKILSESVKEHGGMSLFQSRAFLSRPALLGGERCCLALIFCIIKLLLRRDRNPNKAIVDMIIIYLKRLLHPNPEDMKQNPKTVVCCLDCLWETAAWCEENTIEFIKQGGTFLLLDIVESGTYPMKIIGLGLITDLCETGRCIPHLITWRGGINKKIGLMNLLMNIFRQENKALKVRVNENGIINDIELPLMGIQQWSETFQFEKILTTSPAAVDLLASCRPKIYAIVDLLRNRHAEKVSIAIEHYGMFSAELSALDEITLLLVQNFLLLKMGEVWNEVKIDVKNSAFQPLSIDWQMLVSMMTRARQLATELKKKQEGILQVENIKEQTSEWQLYSKLRETKLAPALDALHELDYIARSTDLRFRIEHKLMQRKQISESKLSQDHELRKHHESYMRKIDPVFNQRLSIQSNKNVEHPKRRSSLKPVSPESPTDRKNWPLNKYLDAEYE